MGASKYLPPFSPEERHSITGDRPAQVPGDPASSVTESEVTYADFLGDEVDD